MKLAIDARAAAEERGGRGRYVREFLRAASALDHDHELVLLARERWEGLPAEPGVKWRLLPAPDPAWHVGAARAANRDCAALLSTNSYLTAWFSRIPTAIVVHDLITFRPALHPQRRASLIERATAPLGVRRAARLVCVSAATERDLVERFPGAAGRTIVVPLAADARFSPAGPDPAPALARLGVRQPYLLATGTLEPRKNLQRLIEASAGHRLVLAGGPGWDAEGILATARANADRVTVLGHVSEEDLSTLYRAAAAFCYPSIYEGFGLPVLEAMASGAPVVTSDVSSLPEVAGDAAVLVDPDDTGSIRAGIERALAEADRRRSAGLARAEDFSWERTARETLGLLTTIASPSPRHANLPSRKR